MIQNFQPKERYTIQDLLEIMEILRSPDGCPWDREQTHQSIRSNFLEETHEALEAIAHEDAPWMQEELGDVLLQIVFHSQLEKETGSFTFDDVVDGICKKLVVRHPHVFGDVKVSGTQDVLKNWDAIKRKTKGDKTQADLLEGLPRTLPALMRAQKVQGRAKRVGFDFADLDETLTTLEGEIRELRQALTVGKPEAVQDELGDVLFSAVNVSRFAKVDAEQALTDSTDKFIKRFSRVEKLSKEQDISLSSANQEQLDSLWDQAKAMD